MSKTEDSEPNEKVIEGKKIQFLGYWYPVESGSELSKTWSRMRIILIWIRNWDMFWPIRWALSPFCVTVYWDGGRRLVRTQDRWPRAPSSGPIALGRYPLSKCHGSCFTCSLFTPYLIIFEIPAVCWHLAEWLISHGRQRVNSKEMINKLRSLLTRLCHFGGFKFNINSQLPKI